MKFYEKEAERERELDQYRRATVRKALFLRQWAVVWLCVLRILDSYMRAGFRMMKPTKLRWSNEFCTDLRGREIFRREEKIFVFKDCEKKVVGCSREREYITEDIRIVRRTRFSRILYGIFSKFSRFFSRRESLWYIWSMMKRSIEYGQARSEKLSKRLSGFPSAAIGE